MSQPARRKAWYHINQNLRGGLQLRPERGEMPLYVQAAALYTALFKAQGGKLVTESCITVLAIFVGTFPRRPTDKAAQFFF